MKTILRTLVVGTMVAFAASTLLLAATATDPIFGNWSLNLSKSKFSPGPAPQSQTRTYADSADGVALTFTGVAADGSAVSGKSTFKYDGKDYPMTGMSAYDTLSLKRINGSTVKSSLKMADKVVGTATRTVSGHGKIMTLTTHMKDAKGVTHDDVAVYDKQ